MRRAEISRKKSYLGIQIEKNRFKKVMASQNSQKQMTTSQCSEGFFGDKIWPRPGWLAGMLGRRFLVLIIKVMRKHGFS